MNPPTNQAPVQSDATSTTPSITPSLLKDGDKVEKEWVDKVKQVVARTHNDPYRQNAELTLIKADYMKQRYNKTIKVEK